VYEFSSPAPALRETTDSGDLVDQIAALVDPSAFQANRWWGAMPGVSPEQVRDREQGSAREKARAILALLGHPATENPAPIATPPGSPPTVGVT
jgi:hypothetical protein